MFRYTDGKFIEIETPEGLWDELNRQSSGPWRVLEGSVENLGIQVLAHKDRDTHKKYLIELRLSDDYELIEVQNIVDVAQVLTRVQGLGLLTVGYMPFSDD